MQSGGRMAAWQAMREALETELGEKLTLDALTGPERGKNDPAGYLQDDAGAAAGWLIAQRARGHRHSIDDVLTAWFALKMHPGARRHLDLGTGIGTVGLLVLWGLGPDARLTGIEAQELSFRLWRGNLAANRLTSRVRALHGDLRALSLEERFPLVTGSPPYFPPGTGVLPVDSQKAHARFELRGDVADYAVSAKKHLEPDGWFVFCFPCPQKARALSAVADAGLAVVEVLDIIPRETLPPLFSLFACRHADEVPEATPPASGAFTVREASGRLTAGMAAVRRVFGFRDSAAHGGHSDAGPGDVPR